MENQKNIYDLNGSIAKYKEYENEAFRLIFNNQIEKISNDLENLTPAKLEIVSENLNKLEKQTQSISDKYKNISNHPWFGFTNSQINPYERNNLVKEFKGTNEIIKKLQNKIDDIKKNIPNADETKNLDSVDGAQKLISLGKIEDLEKTLKYLKYIKNEDDINIVDNLIRIISNNKENLNFEKSLQNKIKIKKSEFKLIKNYIENRKKYGFLSILS